MNDAEPTPRPSLDAIKTALREAADLGDPAACALEGLCIACKEPALPKCRTEAGRREYRISGMCEKCFDACTMEDDGGAEREYDPREAAEGREEPDCE